MRLAINRSFQALLLLLLLAGSAGVWVLTADVRSETVASPSSDPGTDGATKPTPENPSELVVTLLPRGSQSEEQAHDTHDPKKETESRQAVVAKQAEDVFVVVVLDAEGHAVADVEVALLRFSSQQNLMDRLATRSPQRTIRSDQEGRALFPDLLALVEGSSEEASEYPSPVPEHDEVWALRAELTSKQPVYVQLDPTILAQRSCELRLPPLGSVHVLVLGANGEPAHGLHEVQLRLVDPEEASNPLLALELSEEQRETDGSGLAYFERVEVGYVYEARAKSVGAGGISRSKPAVLSHSSQPLVLRVDMGEGHPVLAYRAVNENGSPLRNTLLKIKRFSLFGQEDSFESKTDSDGVFYLEIDRVSLFAGTFVLSVTTDLVRTGSIRVQGQFENGVQESGDVILRPPGHLVSGIVVDSSGKPVRGAKVSAGLNTAFDNNKSQAGPARVNGRSARDGGFSLEGTTISDTFQVWASKGDRRTEPVEVHLGQENLRLELVLQCLVSGRLVVPENGSSAVNVRLMQAGREIAGMESMDDQGDFKLARVPPGLYTLECRLGQVTLFALEDIDVQGDLKLGTIELRDRMFSHTLILKGLDDSAIEGNLRWRVPDDESAAWNDDPIRLGETEFWTSVREVDLEVFVKGYRKEALFRISGRTEVQLKSPYLVRLVLETDGPLPQFPYFFDPALYVAGNQAVGRPVGSRYFTDQHREVRFEVPAAGPLTIAWHLERRPGAGFAIGGGVLSEHNFEINVLDARGEQVFHVPLDSDALRELVESPPF